tara:strand:- start:1193 stop:1621 length:429 start_codon:yes stop_codon:yes gene_type:complete
MGRARSSLQLDIDPDVTIGLGLPMKHDENDGFFPGNQTTLSQTGSNIRNLLLTNKGERVGQPTFGADLMKVLFEPMSDELISEVEQVIAEAMSQWLPHVLVKKLEVNPNDIEPNQLDIDLQFALKMSPTVHDSITLSFLTGT